MTKIKRITKAREKKGGYWSAYRVEGDGVAVAIPEKLMQRSKLKRTAESMRQKQKDLEPLL